MSFERCSGSIFPSTIQSYGTEKIVLSTLAPSGRLASMKLIAWSAPVSIFSDESVSVSPSTSVSFVESIKSLLFGRVEIL